jgi:hypothetical protein
MHKHQVMSQLQTGSSVLYREEVLPTDCTHLGDDAGLTVEEEGERTVLTGRCPVCVARFLSARTGNEKMDRQRADRVYRHGTGSFEYRATIL